MRKRAVLTGEPPVTGLISAEVEKAGCVSQCKVGSWGKTAFGSKCLLRRNKGTITTCMPKLPLFEDFEH